MEGIKVKRPTLSVLILDVLFLLSIHLFPTAVSTFPAV